MDFKDKLNRIINILDINNNMLADELNVDVSLISRWRTGNRLPSERNNHFELMCKYFYSKAVETSKLYDLIETLDQSVLNVNTDINNVIKIMKEWFNSRDEVDNTPLIHDFFNRIDFFSYSDPNNSVTDEKTISNYPYSINDVYYGNQGKREAITRLLTEAIQLEPTTIYIFSDEEISWLTEDITFYFNWSKLLEKLLRKGHKIRILHTVYKSLNEILNAIEKWLPLYLSGNLEPYYYPKLQDGIFRHSMFIVEDTVALSSTSLVDKSDSCLNYYHTNKTNIINLKKTFDSLQQMCLPLMSIYTDGNRREYFENVLDFYRICQDTHNYNQTLSTVTMPLELIGDIHERGGFSRKDSIDFHKKRIEYFEECITKNKYTEIFTLPTVKSIEDGSVYFELTNYFPDGPYSYTKDQFRHHLLNVILMLETYENYHIILLDEKIFNDIRIMVKKGYGSVISKITPRPVIFKFYHEGLSEAIFEYLTYKIKEANQKSYDRNIVLSKLKNLLSQLN